MRKLSRTKFQKTAAGFIAVSGSMLGCAGEVGDLGEDSTRERSQDVIVGDDDRYDVFAYPDATVRELATDSTVALIQKDKLDESDPNDVQIAPTVRSDLCSDERFHDQNQAAVCSGTLIADDLVLTAGHCLEFNSCEDLAFVFGYQQEDETDLAPITSGDVYDCAEVVVQNYEADQASTFDFAVVRLERDATPERVPAAVRTDVELVEREQPLTLIGHPFGLPNKIADSGEVVAIDGYRAYWTSLDGHVGNSGSGVFDEQQRVVGMNTVGVGEDPVYDEQDECFRYGTSPGGGSLGVSYPFHAIRAMCQEIDHPLCGSANPVCGDDVCEPHETHSSCSADCPEIPVLTGADLDVDLAISSEWDAGYCADVVVTNIGDDPRTWEVDLLMGHSTLANSWSANVTVDGDLLQFTPPSWATTLAAGASHNFGFCANKTAPQGTVVIEAVR